MNIYPSIELQNGRCVSLHRGRLDEPQIWHIDPVEVAKSYAQKGAEWVHITDFDAIAGNDMNAELVQNIIQHSGASIQYGGGFRALHRISEWVDHGVSRVVIGTLAVMAPDIVKQAAKLYPDQIVIAVDVYKGKVMSDGWRKPSAITPEAFIRSFEKDPLAAIIVSDIDADLEEADDSLALITQLAGIAKAPVIARGLSRALDDIARLKYVPYVSGALIGRALFNQTINLEDAIKLAHRQEEIADFI
ncbi:MAG: 1-(5-phosphoribosyl)-5-[(5-phosphoribosylamino)methylideneamino] imidazole-4-carboxamide isomerase [Amylibacter sp.]|nr:1-(5-phosphoribosyl)-5-[(5-phosphoribosylamino)methylideneamino] imidazole-4-carboxamide isomerase [Amylibacter sp.]